MFRYLLTFQKTKKTKNKKQSNENREKLFQKKERIGEKYLESIRYHVEEGNQQYCLETVHPRGQSGLVGPAPLSLG